MAKVELTTKEIADCVINALIDEGRLPEGAEEYGVHWKINVGKDWHPSFIGVEIDAQEPRHD